MFYELFLFERNHLCRGGKMIYKLVKIYLPINYKLFVIVVTELVTIKKINNAYI